MGDKKKSEEYEMVPVGPIRRLEERIKKIEKGRESTSQQGFLREILELVQSNQQLVDEIVKANDELRDELSKIPPKIDELLDSWKEFIELLKETGGVEEGGAGGIRDEKMEELIKLNRQMLKEIKSPRRRSKSGGSNRKYPKIRLKK